MSQPSALDDIMSSSSSILSRELIQEIVQGVQDEGLVGPAEVADEVRGRLDRLQRARETVGPTTDAPTHSLPAASQV